MKIYHPLGEFGKTFPVTSGYGWRTLGGVKQFHPALDFGCEIGTPIFACLDGVVIKDNATNSAGKADGYQFSTKGGKVVRTKDADIEIQHTNGWVTRYSHLSTNDVIVGQKVEAGELIGYSGDAGTGPHLHFELKKKEGYGTYFWSKFGYRIEVDPTPYLVICLADIVY